MHLQNDHGGRRGRDRGFNGRVDHLSEVDGLEIELHGSRRNAANVEEIGDEPRLLPCVAIDDFNRLRRLGGIGQVVLQDVRPADDGVQRRSELV